MNKKYIRYFCGFIDAQEKWLISMSKKGYRLVRTGILIYEFEKCHTNQYIYCVDFVAHKSNAELKIYKSFLEDIGYRVMTKNINLNWSIGKIRLRPYGKGFGKITTSPGNYNKELLIVEKENDGKSFELHTTVQDKISYYKIQRNTYLFILLFVLFLFLWNYSITNFLTLSSVAILFLVILAAFPTTLLQKRLWALKKQSSLNE